MSEQNKFDTSILFIILANMVPIIGVIWLGWNVFSVLIFYWLETLIIGFYTIIKILMTRRYKMIPKIISNNFIVKTIINKITNSNETEKAVINQLEDATIPLPLPLRAFHTLAFCFHYGLFMICHLILIIIIGITVAWTGGEGITIEGAIKLAFIVLTGAIFLLISHGISFYQNFIGKKEYEKATIQEITTAPYGRIIVMHLTIVLGGGLLVLTKGPIYIMILFIIIKTIIDIYAHNRQHKKLQTLN